MDFFKNIDAMQVTGEWVICIRQAQPERMTVTVQFKNEACGDAAGKIIPPLVFTDKTAEELDAHLFDDLRTAVPETAKLFSSMEHYLKQREEARKQSQIEKDKADKEKKAKDERKKKFDEAMKKVNELEKDGKFRDAYGKLPNPTDFPEQVAEIEQRRKALGGKFAPDLFGAAEPAITETAPVADEEVTEETDDSLDGDDFSEADEQDNED